MLGTVNIDAYRKEDALEMANAIDDLAERFKQHNGILPIKEGSKQKKIEEYFWKMNVWAIRFLYSHRYRNYFLDERYLPSSNL